MLLKQAFCKQPLTATACPLAGWPQMLSGHLPTVHSLGCQQGVSWGAGSRICIGSGTASQDGQLDRHLGHKARGFSAHLGDTLGQQGAFYFACLAVALPQALSMEQCMAAVKDARACFGRSYAVSVQVTCLHTRGCMPRAYYLPTGIPQRKA